MSKLSTSSKSDIYINLGIIAAATFILILSFFFIYLPWATNHGEEIQTPDLKNMNVDEAESLLSQSNLDYEISDSIFVSGAKPLTVHSQYPKAGELVKKGRKITLTIITDNPPKISLPDVVGRSKESASNLLKSMGIGIESVEFIPAIEKNTVLSFKYEGREMNYGDKLPKGSKITLVVGDGFGNTEMTVPDLTGMNIDEATILISGSSLNLGSILYEDASNALPGTVLRQRPAAGESIKVGEEVNMWIANGTISSDDDFE